MMRSGGPRPRHEPGDAAMNPSESAADLVLAGGPVVTMDAVRRTSSAVAVRGGRIVAVGSVADVESHVGPRTRRIDLAGRTLVPGFQDAHVHPSMAGLNLSRCPLHELPRQLDSYLDAIRAYATAQPERPAPRGGDGDRPPTHPGPDPRGAGKRDRARPGSPAPLRDHRLARRVGHARGPGCVPAGRRARKTLGTGHRLPVVGARPRRRADR